VTLERTGGLFVFLDIYACDGEVRHLIWTLIRTYWAGLLHLSFTDFGCALKPTVKLYSLRIPLEDYTLADSTWQRLQWKDSSVRHLPLRIVWLKETSPTGNSFILTCPIPPVIHHDLKMLVAIMFRLVVPSTTKTVVATVTKKVTCDTRIFILIPQVSLFALSYFCFGRCIPPSLNLSVPMYSPQLPMGELVWNELGRFVSLTSSACEFGFALQVSFIYIPPNSDAVWASFWGMFFRKFFWDFVGGILRDPGGIQYVHVHICHGPMHSIARRPSPRARVFIAIIVKVPFIQIMTMIVGLLILALEWPLPPLKGTRLHRSIPLRVVLLSFQSSFALLFYQVGPSVVILFVLLNSVLQGTNASLYSLIAVTLYIRALNRGENIGPSKEQRGTCGQA